MKAVALIITVLFAAAGANRRKILKLRPLGQRDLVDLTYPFDETTLGYPGLKPFELVITNRGVTDAGYW